nr:MAG TPA: Transcription initiation factor IIE, alpha FINGER, Transcription [Caudoviricetes sp.]
MKEVITKKSKNKELKFVAKCDSCGVSFEYSPNDVDMRPCGAPMLFCPVCGEFVQGDDTLKEVVTKESVNYPNHFVLHRDSGWAIAPQINKAISDALKDIETYNDVPFVRYDVNDTSVIVIRDDDAYEVIVGRNCDSTVVKK